jgi:glycogen operon protein
MVARLPNRLLASPDLYAHEEREPEQSINFITCHDGFTLNDLVSYNEKHNEANNEGNRDGTNDNQSWNCGAEGPTDDPFIERLRNRQVKNFLATTLLSLGVPMLSMGDEVRRTQHGNNNAYCQDNEISWFDWSLLEKHPDVLRFVRKLISFRLDFAATGDEHRDLSLTQFLEQSRFKWHGIQLNRPDWGFNSHSLAVTMESWRVPYQAHVMLNAYWEPLGFELPPLPGGPEVGWRRMIDTYLTSPQDFCDLHKAPLVESSSYLVPPRSIVMLVAEIPRLA